MTVRGFTHILVGIFVSLHYFENGKLSIVVESGLFPLDQFSKHLKSLGSYVTLKRIKVSSQHCDSQHCDSQHCDSQHCDSGLFVFVYSEWKIIADLNTCRKFTHCG